MATIKVNGTLNGFVHKGDKWMSIATAPDVCKTPSPGGPVPLPYPNMSDSSSLSDGTTTVKVDGGNMAAIKGSKFATSTGDEPGTAGGGVKSSKTKGASTWILYSFDVKLDGANACRFTDKKMQNDENTIDAMGVIPKIVEVELDEVEMKCGELGQYGEQQKVSGGGKSDRDHVPAKSSLLERAVQLRRGKALKDCQKAAIVKGALAIVIPKAVHQQFSETYGGRATPESDAKDLQKAAKSNLKEIQDSGELDEACAEAYKKAAEKIEQITNEQYDSWLKKMIASC
ncbi:DUF4150 domain-containing protein [Ideonella sp.]|uniref:DUF4150 domain-containing protein n=1 Tax=Ideonella sp. TaxID=1929293 RepID=UPI0035B24181